jgi:dTDP-4-amino-4,6-dideoxygalactose transaminase
MNNATTRTAADRHPPGAGHVAGLESDLAQVFGTRHAVAVNAGTAAIHCALLACGIGPGDEVLVPALSVVMSAAPVLYCGARPVFIDCDTDGTAMDPGDLTAKTTPRAKAVLAVYLWGRSGDPAWLAEFARTHGLRLIEDACQAHGASFAGHPLGTFGDAAALSFHYTKIIECGEGGAVLSSSDEVAQECRALRTHWQDPPDGQPPLSRLGYNYRLAEPLAALARTSLAQFTQLLARRKQQTARMQAMVTGTPGITVPAPRPGEDWNGYAPLFRLHLPRPRAFSQHLAACGVPNSVGSFGLAACDQRPPFASYVSAPCRNAARLIDATLAVALTNTDRDDQIARYARTITSEARRWAA